MPHQRAGRGKVSIKLKVSAAIAQGMRRGRVSGVLFEAPTALHR
jgi:hypothetical protein